MKDTDNGVLRDLEAFLGGEILGQPEACRIFARTVRRGEMGYMDENRPRSFTLALGETGVGKTETALTSSRHLFGSDEFVIRLDMAEFKDRTTGLARMVGGPGEDGLLAQEMDRVDALMETVKGRRRGRFLLLDEIEKADPDVAKLLLGLEAARLRTSSGRVLNFSDTHIVCTANLGSETAKELSESESTPYSTILRTVSEEARGFFSSAAFARFTEVIVYRSLPVEIQRLICQLKLGRKVSAIERKLRSTIRVGPGVVDYLVRHGFHQDLGARMMRNAIERSLGDAFVAWELEHGITKQALLLTGGFNGLGVVADDGSTLMEGAA